MKRKFLLKNKNKMLTFLISLFSMFMLVSVGFATWCIGGGDGGAVNNDILVAETRDGSVDYNVVTDGNQDYIDMRFTKQYLKSSFTQYARDRENNTKNVEYVQANLKWKNVNSSYNDDVCEYFYLTDNDNPLGDNAPKIYNHETGDTIRFDKEQRIYRDTNTFTSSLAYSNAYQKYDTSCTPDWTNFEPVYDTNYENAYADGGSSASSYGGEWMTVGTNITGNDFKWCRVDLRCLKKSNKYYFFIFYVFHYTTAHPYGENIVCRYRGNLFQTYSSQCLDDYSYLSYVKTYTKDNNTYTSGLVSHDTNKYTAKYLRLYVSYKRTSGGTTNYNNVALYPCTPYGEDGKSYNSNYYYYNDTSSSVLLTNPTNYANNITRSILREVDYTQPIVGNAWPYSVTASEIKWSYSFTYYIKHVESPTSKTGTGTISTPLNYVFDHFELEYKNQYQYSGTGAQPAKFYFTNTETGETLIKTINENISTRSRNFLFKMVNRIKEDSITFDYSIRLRPKNDTVRANMKDYIKAYTFSLTFDWTTFEVANLARTS